jgi:hypothetical protein
VASMRSEGPRAARRNAKPMQGIKGRTMLWISGNCSRIVLNAAMLLNHHLPIRNSG